MTEQATTHRCRFCGEPRPYANSPCAACATFGAAPAHPLDTPLHEGTATRTSYERQAHDRADRLSRQHEDEYYVMRDECREPDEPEGYYVVSGTRFDAGMAKLDSCTVVAAYSGGCRLPN